MLYELFLEDIKFLCNGVENGGWVRGIIVFNVMFRDVEFRVFW